MSTVNELTVQEVREKIVAIVKFGPAGFDTDGVSPGEYYQVTIDPAKISPSGKFIRFGTEQGDEIMGWQRAEAITIIEVLGSWGANNEPPLLAYGGGGVVGMGVLVEKDKETT